ncbi:MAG TPA: cation-translocating P-type ATPase [Ferruginibacter sp.]|nr:cation-translocating P-type ATPase [Ferruginibacter sp.]HMP20818.1 cation-translocating P-type ATPase [Ferruginibacter sp.]
MEKIEWKVEGMDCTNCAITISRFLEKEGMQQVKVNFIGGDISFENTANAPTANIAKGIEGLGYKVIKDIGDNNARATTAANSQLSIKNFFSNHLQRFLFCLPFTLVLMLHMLPLHHLGWFHTLMNPWLQLVICLPVYIVGMSYFGISAVKSLKAGVPNMNVLIAMGATAAFVYSLTGTLLHLGMDYVFYETTATIITLVFLGEWIENKAVQLTQKELNTLLKQQKVMANMIAFDEQHRENIFPVESSQLRTGDLVLIKTGEQVPVDCKILWGEMYVNEALLTGESAPVYKTKKDVITGGSICTDGTVKAQVTAVGKEAVLGTIVNLVKQAQADKPPVQQLADKISAIFVPVVLGIAALSFLINFFLMNVSATASLMRSIAVLVISCPCAMGLATPAAIAVGLGRGARRGILFRNARSLELFKSIGIVVFDKTGTLTRGKLALTGFFTTIDEMRFKQICYSIEKYSNHPVAKAVVEAWKTDQLIKWKRLEEIKGAGMEAVDNDGNEYRLVSYKAAAAFTKDNTHSAYLLQNDVLIGWIDTADALREESADIVRYLKGRNIKTVILSGDSAARCKEVAMQLGIDTVYAEKTPGEKLQVVEQLNQELPVAMIGDGINDSPALAKATIGITMSDAAHLAVQSAQVVLTNNGIKHLPLALGLGRHTYSTIKQNLFWAFIYNVIAIPIAAAGMLQPGLAALAMGFSDVVLAANSLRLNYKKVI